MFSSSSPCRRSPSNQMDKMEQARKELHAKERALKKREKALLEAEDNFRAKKKAEKEKKRVEDLERLKKAEELGGFLSKKIVMKPGPSAGLVPGSKLLRRKQRSVTPVRPWLRKKQRSPTPPWEKRARAAR